MKDIQTICLSNDGFGLLILSSQIKSADYDYAGAVWEQKVKDEKHQSGLMAPEIDLAWSFLWTRPLTWKQAAQIYFVKWRRDLVTCLKQY